LNQANQAPANPLSLTSNPATSHPAKPSKSKSKPAKLTLEAGVELQAPQTKPSIEAQLLQAQLLQAAQQP